MIVMLLWFVKSIIESSVQERMADRDTERINEWAQAHGERIGVTTRLQEQTMLSNTGKKESGSNKKKGQQ